MATPHFTIANCPNCGAHERAVGHWTAEGHAEWYCFNCKATGRMVVSIDEGSPVPPQDIAGKTPA